MRLILLLLLAFPGLTTPPPPPAVIRIDDLLAYDPARPPRLPARAEATDEMATSEQPATDYVALHQARVAARSEVTRWLGLAAVLTVAIIAGLGLAIMIVASGSQSEPLAAAADPGNNQPPHQRERVIVLDGWQAPAPPSPDTCRH